MRQFDASERAVRWALDELRRQGRIVRRQGVGTFIAENPPATSLVHPVGALGGGHSLVPSSLTDSRTVVAITKPDHSLFDRAMKLLYGFVEASDLSLVCRFVNSWSPQLSELPLVSRGTEQPLGFIVFSHWFFPLARQLQEAGHRVVLVGAPPVDVSPEVPNVYCDQETGGYLMARHLLELGHRRIAFQGTDDLEKTRRWNGYQRALAEARRKGIEVETSRLLDSDIERWRQDLKGARAFFENPSRPTAIAMWNDRESILIYNVLSRLGIGIPQDVSIIGYDDLPEALLLHPALTTVDCAIEQQLQAALNLLTRSTPPVANQSLMVLPHLIRRDSTARITPETV